MKTTTRFRFNRIWVCGAIGFSIGLFIAHLAWVDGIVWRWRFGINYNPWFVYGHSPEAYKFLNFLMLSFWLLIGVAIGSIWQRRVEMAAEIEELKDDFEHKNK